jgi:cobalamin 5'-phosphate synthase/cobalamin synthase
MKYLRSFALAFNMLSIIPFFKVHHFFKGINGYSAMFYPFVGFILGSILYLISVILAGVFPSAHLHVIIFSFWVFLSGAIHLDGLSDSIDGLFVQKEKSLEVMKDSHVGGMGMIFSFVFLALKLSSVIYLEAFYLLPIVLMFSRLNATLAIYFYNYISDGVGMLIKKELSLKMVHFATLSSLIIASFFHVLSMFLLSLSVLIVIAIFFKSRLGGLNGDVYGLIIEVNEVVLLNYILLSGFL